MLRNLEIYKTGDIKGLPVFEVKHGNTTYTVSGEYSQTSALTLKQRLEQIILDKTSDMRWIDTPLECTATPSEMHDEA